MVLSSGVQKKGCSRYGLASLAKTRPAGKNFSTKWQKKGTIYRTSQYGSDRFLRVVFSKASCLYSTTPASKKGWKIRIIAGPATLFWTALSGTVFGTP
jgi:hypothetical protein